MATNTSKLSNIASAFIADIRNVRLGVDAANSGIVTAASKLPALLGDRITYREVNATVDSTMDSGPALAKGRDNAFIRAGILKAAKAPLGDMPSKSNAGSRAAYNAWKADEANIIRAVALRVIADSLKAQWTGETFSLALGALVPKGAQSIKPADARVIFGKKVPETFVYIREDGEVVAAKASFGTLLSLFPLAKREDRNTKRKSSKATNVVATFKAMRTILGVFKTTKPSEAQRTELTVLRTMIDQALGINETAPKPVAKPVTKAKAKAKAA